jgi:hypothetical protein
MIRARTLRELKRLSEQHVRGGKFLKGHFDPRMSRLYAELVEAVELKKGQWNEQMLTSLKYFLEQIGPTIRVPSRLTFYPIDSVPAGQPTARPYNEDYYELRVFDTYPPPEGYGAGFVTANSHTGEFTAVGSLFGGHMQLGAGPIVTVTTSVDPVDLFISLNALLDFEFSFEAYLNPQFKPSAASPDTNIRLDVLVRTVLSVTDKVTGAQQLTIGGWTATLLKRFLLHQGAAPDIPDVPNQVIQSGTSLQGGDVGLIAIHKAVIPVPPNSIARLRVFFALHLGASGARQRSENRHITYADVRAWARFPSIAVTMYS